MSNLSQDLQKLQQEALIAEQKANHKNAEVQAAQKTLSTLHIQIDRETKRLLAEQGATIAAGKAELDALHTSLREGGKVFLAQRKEQETYYTKVQTEIADSEATLKVHSDRNVVLQEDNHALLVQIDKYHQDIDILKSQKTTLEQELSALTAQILPLTEEIATLQARTAELKQADAKANEVYAAEIAKKQEEVGLLDAQLLRISQETNAVHEEETSLRDLFATREIELERRDQNLRIRELKVQQGEDKIIRNSNLLNL